MIKSLPKLLSNRAAGAVLWFAFVALFYQTGLDFTILLLEPEQFTGGWQWLRAALFPLLLPGFFLLFRRFGCASGSCRNGQCQLPGRQVATPEDQNQSGPFLL